MTTSSVEIDAPRPDSGAPWSPATITVCDSGLGLAEWVESGLDTARELLTHHGAIRIRGAAVNVETFGQTVSAVAGSPLGDYVQRSTPRTRVDGKVFTSTEYRADQTIPMHSEQSYATTWPKVVGFWCRQPATTGGETPLAPTAGIFAALPQDLIERFDAVGVRYERWYQPFLDLPWQEVFQTDDPAEVERLCGESGIDTDWYDGGVLRTRQVAQATLRHKDSGRHVWFNQAALFHPSALPPALEAALRARAGDRLPRNALLGDGQPIPAADIAEIIAATERVTWRAPWAADDVVIVDNEAVAHGRAPFTGDRTVLVAMAGKGSQ